MIQLSYQPALDPFHAVYRYLRILSVIDTSKSLPVDHSRILDFYLLFPFRISGIRLKTQHRRFRGLADIYKETRPYGNQPADAQLFARMKPMQVAALETLAEKKFIESDELKNGKVVRTQRPIPPSWPHELMKRIRTSKN
jgi:hypothetical protein